MNLVCLGQRQPRGYRGVLRTGWAKARATNCPGLSAIQAVQCSLPPDAIGLPRRRGSVDSCGLGCGLGGVRSIVRRTSSSVIAMIEMTPEQANAFRSRAQSSPDWDLMTDVGYFLIWYAAVELAITLLLAQASGSKNLQIFDTLCSGMDARVKIERFRSIAKGKIGPNLTARLKHFEEKARPIRNRLAHAMLTRSESGPSVYFASSLSSMPWREWGEPDPGYPTAPPIVITPEQLLGWGAWFTQFAQDLHGVFIGYERIGVFEIANPKTPEPPVGRASPKPKPARAKSRNSGQTPPVSS
jgi:hypothetical protein